MNIIKKETVRFVRVKTIHYIILTVVITAIVLLAAAAVANAMQISMLVSKAEATQHKIDILRREQEINKALREGQAQLQERIDTMALENTGRVFSIEKYRQWNKANSGGNRLPDWVHACNGQPVLKENDIADLVRGLDGEYRPSAPEWEVPASAAYLHT